jgi:glutamyl-tRNA synthetase
MNKPVRTRFAPSPTGLLHIGGVRTALFNYLYAKKNNGVFILRLEDTDRERFVEEGVEQIIQSLDWVGIHPDEGVWHEEKPGEHAPYIQSKRLNHYTKYAQKLVDDGKAYYSHITPEAFTRLREESINAKKPFVYKQSMEPTLQNRSNKELPIRFKVPEGNTKWNDEVRGNFDGSNDLIDDFIIIKADGYPTYNFANVIDDHLMNISHVIRGDEFIGSTAKHVLLYKAFGFEQPNWVHLPSILGPEGKKKLSKRDGDVEVLNYRETGYLPGALVNFLALLGWNDGSEQEIFSINELVDRFDLNRVQKSPAVFDKTRLDWMNGEYIRKLPIQELLSHLKPFIPPEWYKDTNYLEKVVMLDRERLKTLADARYLMEIFFKNPKVDKDLLCKKDDIEDIKKWLKRAKEILESIEFNHDSLDKSLRDLTEELGIKTAQLFYAIRIALTGRTEAPGLFDIMLTLGKQETIKRIENVN